jgi:hypothetical protein
VSDQIDLLDEPRAATRAPAVPHGGEAGMRAATAAHEDPTVSEEKRALVLLLQREAFNLWRARKQAISVNDVRHLLEQASYSGDPRVLSAAFPRGEWTAVGYVHTTSPAANQRDVRTFVPRSEYAWWRANTQEGREYQPRRVRV